MRKVSSSPRITKQIKRFTGQPKINQESVKGTLQNLEQRLKALERNPSLGAPVICDQV